MNDWLGCFKLAGSKMQRKVYCIYLYKKKNGKKAHRKKNAQKKDAQKKKAEKKRCKEKKMQVKNANEDACRLKVLECVAIKWIRSM